jgi:hypothetical protein
LVRYEYSTNLGKEKHGQIVELIEHMQSFYPKFDEQRNLKGRVPWVGSWWFTDPKT